jgi:perosamine synthetase
MTDMQATLGLCQLEVLDEILAERTRLAERYNEALEHVPFIEPPHSPDYAQRTWQAYAVRLGEGAPDRTELMRALLHDGVPTRRGVMASHLEPAYAGVVADLPHTEDVTANTLMLPLFAGLTDEQLDYVVERLTAHVAERIAA